MSAIIHVVNYYEVLRKGVFKVKLYSQCSYFINHQIHCISHQVCDVTIFGTMLEIFYRFGYSKIVPKMKT